MFLKALNRHPVVKVNFKTNGPHFQRTFKNIVVELPVNAQLLSTLCMEYLPKL